MKRRLVLLILIVSVAGAMVGQDPRLSRPVAPLSTTARLHVVGCRSASLVFRFFSSLPSPLDIRRGEPRKQSGAHEEGRDVHEHRHAEAKLVQQNHKNKATITAVAVSASTGLPDVW